MSLDDLVLTIESDDENNNEESQRGFEAVKVKQKTADKSKTKETSTLEEKDTLNADFVFDVGGDIYDEVLNGKDALGDLVKGSKKVRYSYFSAETCYIFVPGTYIRR